MENVNFTVDISNILSEQNGQHGTKVKRYSLDR